MPLKEVYLIENSDDLNLDLVKNISLPSFLENSSEKRILEFKFGRYCVNKALEKIGHEPITLGINESDRAPIWPNDLVGSLSHKNSLYIAVVGKSSDYLSLGIDIEFFIQKERFHAIEKLVLTDSDKTYIDTLGDDLSFLYTLIFSAKESLYKLIYPLSKTYFDFREANFVSLDTERSTFDLEIISDKDGMKNYKKRYKGEYILNDKYIITQMSLTKS